VRRRWLAKRKGYTVADAAGVFDTSFKRPGITECGCNMHARRYFRMLSWTVVWFGIFSRLPLRA